MITIKKMGMLCGLLSSLSSYAGTMGAAVVDNPWFGAIGTGYSWTTMPGIQNPNPSQWDTATQGYDGSIGNRGFITFALGKQIHQYIDLSVMYMMHENFNYQKYQSGTSSATPDFTGYQRNRYFTLNNKSILVNGFLHPADAWKPITHVSLTPYIGVGIGYAYNYINDFYTVGTETIQGTAVGSVDSQGTPIGTNAFAWQGTVAMNIRLQNSHFSVNTGYRYYDGGQFNGSSSIYTNAGGFVNATPWSGEVKANQYFVEFKYSI